MTTGLELRELREAAGLTQVQVAARLGVTRITVINWEQRARVLPPKAARYRRAVDELTRDDAA